MALRKKRSMIVIGLTGSIGMGKTTVARLLRQRAIPIYSADKAIHALLKKGGRAVKPVGKIFPASLRSGKIDRKILGAEVFQEPQKLQALEEILHPLIRNAEKEFLKKSREQNKSIAVLEIPLLFETGAERRCDVTVCVTAPAEIQKQRVLARPGMTQARMRAILKRQMPDREKRRKADFVVPTGKGLKVTQQHLDLFLTKLGLPNSSVGNSHF